MEKIVGLIDAPFTPFHPNGDVNLEPIGAYAAMLQKNRTAISAVAIAMYKVWTLCHICFLFFGLTLQK